MRMTDRYKQLKDAEHTMHKAWAAWESAHEVVQKIRAEISAARKQGKGKGNAGPS